MQAFIDSSDLVTDGPALAERVRRDGYLFLPRLLPRHDVATVQRQIAEKNVGSAAISRWAMC
jgi:hypothetical protein